MKNKNAWICILFILAGLVIGGLLGELASNVDFLWWLSYGQSFGLSTPVTLDLSVLKISIQNKNNGVKYDSINVFR